MKNPTFSATVYKIGIPLLSATVILSLLSAPEGKERSPVPMVKLPAGYIPHEARNITWREDGFDVRLYSRSFSQGDVVYLELVKREGTPEDIRLDKISFQGKEFLHTRKTWGYRSFFSLDPNKRAGAYVLHLEMVLAKKKYRGSFGLDVADARFPVSWQELDLGKYSNMTYLSRPDVIKRIQECSKKKKKAFSLISDDMVSSSISHPRDIHEITSPFWAQRHYYTYETVNGRNIRTPTRKRIHRGLDLKGEKGAPVYALADGKIAIAEEMFYEGNFVVIDHGNRIFSYYMHHDSLAVKEGQKVRGGDIIGYVGSTGVSTGAHLHVSMIINGIQADPLSILGLPIR